MASAYREARFLRRMRNNLCSTTVHARSGQAMLAVALAALVGVSPLHAQQTAPADNNGNPGEGGDIIVTGSQIARPGFVSATPITNVTSADILRVGAVNVADALNQLPALKPSITPSSVSNLSKLAGGNYMDLRGLGYLRTLTVIDGKRYVPTTPEGVINTNLIPQALIGSVDVVTGGASAAYGSDAVAGVVNFKIDNTFNGLRGSIQGGITDHNDNRNYLASFAFGTEFAEGRGHLLVGVESAQNSGIKDANQRKWAGNRSLIVNPANETDPSQPFLIHVNDARASYAAPGGVITSGVLSGIQFGANGSPMPFRYGAYLTEDNTMDGGDGDELASPYVLVAPTKRQSAYAGINYELTESLTAYASFTYARSRLNERSIPADDVFTIQADNAYLPASLRSALAAADESSFTFGRSLEDYGVGRIKQKAHTWQAMGGLKGGIVDSWTFDTSFSYGKTRTLTLFTDDVIKANRLLALDAVVNPATGGIVCRSTLTDPTNGCVPLNLFGVGSASPQAIDYITGTSVRDWRQSQGVVDLVVRGNPISTWAGPVSVAFGGEFRRLNVDVASDPISATPNKSLFRVGNVKPYSAHETVKEGFVEVVVPLAKDQSWAKNLEIDLGGRITDYRTSGTVETWKAGVNYALNDSIRFRATRSRDIRAPNINELFAAGQTLIGGVTDTKTNATYTVSQTTGGNPYLKPEKADTLTAGVVLTPSFAPRLSVSIDYYDIKVKGAIASLTAQTIVTRCNSGDAASCLLVQRGSDGRISNILLAPVNFQKIITNGIDVEVAYRLPIGNGMLDLRGLTSYVNKLNLVGQNGDVTKFAGNTDQPVLDGPGGTPHWRANVSANYSTDNYRFGITGRYVGGGVITRDDVTLDWNNVSGRFYVDLSGEFTLFKTSSGGKVALFGTILNALDKDPPFTGYQFQTARQLYDVIGRQYTAGVRFNF